MSPSEIADGLSDIRLRRYVSSFQSSSFWKWTTSQRHQYLCYALEVTRSFVR